MLRVGTSIGASFSASFSTSFSTDGPGARGPARGSVRQVPFDDGRQHVGVDPWLVGEEDRDPTRRLRGRLPAPVTVWTAATRRVGRAGITVSSVIVAEGEPPEIAGLIGPLSDLWDAAAESRRFVLHALTADQLDLAERFALRWPGDPFEGLDVTATEWGPQLEAVSTRASCSVIGSSEAGHGILVRARVERVVIGGGTRLPLVHYRGAYATVGRRPRPRPQEAPKG